MNTNSTQTSNSILSEKYFCGIDLASKVIQVSVTRPNEESYDLSLKIKGNYSEPYRPKIMSGVPSKAAFNALTAFMPFFLAVPM